MMIIQRAIFALLLVFLAVPAAGSTTFEDNFQQSGTAWRHGYKIWSEKPGPLVFNRKFRSATLSGTAVHPDLLDSFSATVRFRFGETEGAIFTFGWGKPFEWDEISACWGKVAVERSGGFRVEVAGKTLGSGTLVPEPNGDFVLSLVVSERGVVVGETQLDFPAGQVPRPGFCMIRIEGTDPFTMQPMASMQAFRVASERARPPMSEAEVRANADEWTRVSIRENDRTLDELEASVAKAKEAGTWGFATDLTVQPALVRTGEPVTLTFRARGPAPAPSKAWVVPDYLGAKPGEQRPLALDWKPAGPDAHVAVVKLVPDRPGNWSVNWKMEGKAGPETLTRMLGVIEEGYAVYRFQFTTQPAIWEPELLPKDFDGKPYSGPQAFDVLHQYGLAGDFWIGEFKYGRYLVFPPEQTMRNAAVLRKMQHQFGSSFSPLFNADWILPKSPDRNLFRVPVDVQRTGLNQLKRCWDLLGFAPLHLLATYTQGHETPGLAKEAGVKALDNMCQWQNWLDGHSGNDWLINHVGAPPFPYYVADDDFRKVAPGRSIVQLPQGTASAVRLYTVTAMEGCPKNAFLSTDSNYAPKMIGRRAQSANTDRLETAIDMWNEMAAYQKEPLFLSISMENFTEREDWNLASVRAVEYLRNKARTEKIVFTQGEGMADYFLNHYDRQPENWIYWPDIYAGLTADFKPAQLADHIEVSNAEFHSDHWDGNALPRFYWDHTKPWSNPVWDDAAGLRKSPPGLIPPDLIKAETFTPKMEDLSGVKAEVRITAAGESGVRVAVVVDSPRAYSFLPIAVWRIPFAGKGLSVESPANARFLPIVDGSTGNLHGVAVCREVKAGRNEWIFELKGEARPFEDPQIVLGDSVLGRMFLRNSVPHAYLWLAEGAAPARLTITAPSNRKVQVHYNDGTTEETTGGTLSVRLSGDWPTKSPMVIGLTNQELRDNAQLALEANPG
jgi:hypothetical protein